MISSENELNRLLDEETRNQFKEISGILCQYTALHNTLDQAGEDAQRLELSIRKHTEPAVQQARSKNEQDEREIKRWLDQQ